MKFIKMFLNKFLNGNNDDSFMIDESKIKIDSNLESIFSKKNEDQKGAITTAVAMQFLLQATADAEDARQSGIKSGLIAEWMTKEQSLAYLYAQYVFLGYEKKYSPALVGSFIKKYCTDSLFLDFSFYYIQIANAQGFEIDSVLFDSDKISPQMDIAETAERMKSLGYKKHWIPPFKEPYKQQWINFY